MTKSLFRQSFLLDSLDFDHPMLAQSVTTEQGVTLQLHQPGVLEVIPAEQDQQTQHIVICAALHGDDAAPIELMDKWLEDIQSGFQVVTERCLFILAHPLAIQRQVRFIDQDLNQLFDEQAHAASCELAIAETLKARLKSFFQGTEPSSRWHFDLQCASRDSKHYSFAISPKSRHAVRSRRLLQFIEHAHIDAVMLSNAPSNRFSCYSADQFAAQALTLELGQVARLGEHSLHKLVAFDLAVRDLIARHVPEHLPRKTVMYRVSRTIVRLHENFTFRFNENVENFTTFMHGEVFGYDGDKPLMAKNEGEAIVFPDPHVAIGQAAALMVCKVNARYEDDQLVYD